MLANAGTSAKHDQLLAARKGHRHTVWEAQLARLAAYKAAHGDCSVPGGWADDRRLAGWVQNQREGKRKLDHGEPSPGITAERVARLTALST